MPKKHKTRRRNAIAKDLRTPKYKLRVVQSKKKKKEPRQKTQKEIRAEQEPDRRCPIPGCHFGKAPWQSMCEPHWHKLPAGVRAEIDRTARWKAMRSDHLIIMRDAKIWLAAECAPFGPKRLRLMAKRDKLILPYSREAICPDVSQKT